MPGMTMSAAFDIDEARKLARQLVETEASRVGRIDLAQERVARRTGVSPTTIDNLRRGRLKSVAGWITSRLRTALEENLQHEIERLEHQLELVRQCRGHVTADKMASAQALLRQARELMGI